MTAKIKLNAASGGGSVSLKAPSTTTSNAAVELQLPVADGTSGQVIKTDGSGNLSFAADAGGQILQMQHFRKGDHASATINGSSSGSSNWDYTGFSPAITPTASTSDILMLGHISVGGDSCLVYIEVMINGSKSAGGPNGDSNGNRRTIHSSGNNENDRGGESIPINYVFTPGTTATQTYNFRFNHDSANNKTLYINRSTHTDNNQRQGDAISHITLMEVAA